MISFSKLKNAADTLSTILVTVAAALVLFTQIQNRWFPRSAGSQVQEVHGLTIEANKIRHIRGTGKTALVEFTDYECPFCGQHARTTGSKVQKQLIETGIVRHVVFNFPLEIIHHRARKAGEAAECASQQGHFWEMHERLFEDQYAFGDEALAKSSAVLGISRETFVRCLDGQAADQVAADVAEGQRLGVRSTPTFFIGAVQTDGSINLQKRVTGAIPFDDLKGIVETMGSTRASARP